MAFEPAYAAPPRVAVGLSWLDLDHTADTLSVTARAEDISDDHFTATIDTNDNPSSRIFSAACSWLEASASEPDIQMGEWEVPIPPPSSSPNNKTPTKILITTQIKFPTRFFPSTSNNNNPNNPNSNKITILPFLKAFTLGTSSPWRLKTYATAISPFKFKLHLETWSDVDLRGATVSWVAFPSSSSSSSSSTSSSSSSSSTGTGIGAGIVGGGIVGGSFATDDVPGLENWGRVEFFGDSSSDPSSPDGNGSSWNGNGTEKNGGVLLKEEEKKKKEFHAPPAVMTAISGFDFERGRNLRLRASSSAVTSRGMTWHLDSWLDSGMNTASGVYIAVYCPSDVAEW